ncbi:hypothetical protein F511_29282 [Dorcoceras hygrometricum]|uniref:Uncharacterized protein n=1 Tax=Dorcoceras hygrometricum TaxID=472368 RepID=A0A2Z7CVA9_9LAMI|nr:hypothetical protein F511_29282 [Dorcoceras hygrometricum]
MRAIGALSSLRAKATVIASPIVSKSFHIEQLAIENASQMNCSISLRRRFCSVLLSGSIRGSPYEMQLNYQNNLHLEMPSMVGPRVAFSSEASIVENNSSDTETAKEVYEKMLKCVSEKRSAPPNAWLWSLVAKCGTDEDIKLLFDILERLRRFRLSNLRIPDNFNSALCRDVTKACVRVGAIEFGKKALWKHNLYGLSPDIGSAHSLLLHAQQHNDVKLMVEVMKLVKKNGLPLQPDTETAKEVYEKMLKCVSEKRSAPPNAWLWSLVAKCGTDEDIKLLFDILERLRRFRLSNLRIPDNFNSALCRDVTKACVRVGAIEFGKKALWKHNLYGLSPDIGSAHSLLLHAQQHNDVKLMVEVMKLVKKNGLPLQPGTADIVFSICYSADRWGLISKYGRRFVKSGVRLRQTSFDLWMEFAARIGDTESLWEIEKWRSESMKQHTLSTAFSCAKGLLLDHKPESAAAIIQAINQSTSDTKRTEFVVELQKLVSEWPLEVIKHKKEENKEAFVAALQNNISSLINALSSVGVATNLSMEDLTTKGVLS